MKVSAQAAGALIQPAALLMLALAAPAWAQSGAAPVPAPTSAPTPLPQPAPAPPPAVTPAVTPAPAPPATQRIEIAATPDSDAERRAESINMVLREPPKSRQREWRSNLGYRAVQPGGGLSFQWGDRVDDLAFVLPASVSHAVYGGASTTERISRSPDGDVQEQAITANDHGRNLSSQVAPRLQWKLNATDTMRAGALAQHGASHGVNLRSYASLQGKPWSTVADRGASRSTHTLLHMNLQWQRRWLEGGKFEFNGSWQDQRRRGRAHYEAFDSSAALAVQRDSSTRRRWPGGARRPGRSRPTRHLA